MFMEKFIHYIEQALPDHSEEPLLFQFKKKTLDEMNALSATIEKRGLKDKTVREDLIISEYPDLPGSYEKYYAEKTAEAKSKRNLFMNIVGSAAFILILIIVFLASGFISNDWGHMWVLLVDGFLLWIDYLMLIGVKKITSLSRIYHIFARILLGMAVVVFSVAVFLVAMVFFHVASSWLIVIGGIAAIFVADSIYITVTGQKLTVIFYLVYIPAIASMLYIILSVMGKIAWTPGWVMVPLSLIIDVAVIAALVIRNKKAAMEVAKYWNED